MAVFNLNLAKNYCSHWGIWEAIREVLQNGEDQFTLNSSNEINVEYNERNQKLLISNKESILERRTLLLGVDDKSKNQKLIGKFGEGYKIALLILTKLNKKVVIKNYKKNEKWTPELNKDPKYQNEYVLKVNIKKYLFKGERDNNLTWEINGITPKEWSEINEKYLRYQDLGKTFTDKCGSQILFEEKYNGKVFVNGLFIEHLKCNLAHGYNLCPDGLELDRDRKTIEGFDFFRMTDKILTSYSLKHPEDIPKILANLDAEVPYDDYKYFLYDTLFVNEKIISSFSNEAKKIYEKENVEKKFPVSNNKEKDYALLYYPNAQIEIVSKKTKNLLSKTEEYSDINAFMNKFNKNEEVAILEPNEVINAFIKKFSDQIYNMELSNGFKELLELSKNWENKKVVPIEINDSVDVDVIKKDETVSTEIDKYAFKYKDSDYDEEIPF